MSANHVLLQRIELSSSATAITFRNIPQSGYTDLKMFVTSKVTSNTGGYQTFIRFNEDSASNYSWRNIIAYSGTNTGTQGSSDTGMRIALSSTAEDSALTYSNSELYISGYLSSGEKYISAESGSEYLGTAATVTFGHGDWSGTATIKSITVFPESASFAAGSTFSLYGIATVDTIPASAPKAIGGDIITNDGEYWYHAFFSSGRFKANNSLNCDVLLVGGGAGGIGAAAGGGGGAGGVVYSTKTILPNYLYPVSVGAGGAGTMYFDYYSNSATSSQFAGLTAYPGSSYYDYDNSALIGSGSGQAVGGGGTAGTIGYSTSGQGNNGGTGQMNSSGGSRQYLGGGGGGAGGVGGNSSGTTSGAGGAGTSSYHSWLQVVNAGVLSNGFYYIAGGGSGGAGRESGGGGVTAGAGGVGGGGVGSNYGTYGTDAAANTGGGGGGGTNGGASAYGTYGGSGLVIIRYPMA